MKLEAGLQLHLPTYRRLSLPALLQLARESALAGFEQIWVTDNLESRNPFVVLTALAQTVATKLGTAIMGQYFRSPIAAAASIIPISELLNGRELSIGIGTGNPSTARLVDMPRSVTFMRETALSLRALLSGERVELDDYRLVGDYFNFAPKASVQIATGVIGPIRIYGGGNGPRGLAMAGELMDGLIVGSSLLPDAAVGRLGPMIALADEAAARAGVMGDFRRVAEVKISISKDGTAARRFVATGGAVALRTLFLRRRGFRDDELERLGISPVDANEMERLRSTGVPVSDLDRFVTDQMIDASFIAGDPSFCRERIKEVVALAHAHGFAQLMFSELGPDPREAVELLGQEILPLIVDPSHKLISGM